MLKTTKNILLTGSSKTEENLVIASFSANIAPTGAVNINTSNTNSDTAKANNALVQADLNAFIEQAYKLAGGDTDDQATTSK